MNEKQQDGTPLLQVDHLAVTFYTSRGTFRVKRQQKWDTFRA